MESMFDFFVFFRGDFLELWEEGADETSEEGLMNKNVDEVKRC